LVINIKYFFFGGGDGARILNDSFIFDPETTIYTQPQITGASPAARCAHTTTFWEGKLLIFGGGDGSRRFKDLYVFDTELLGRIELGREKKPKLQVKKQEEKLKNPEEAKYKDVTMWLQSIGMRKYAEKFVREEIDIKTLPGLNETHLERIGVSTIGARLHILNAIAALTEKKISVEEETLYTLKQVNKSLENLTLFTQVVAQTIAISHKNDVHNRSPNSISPQLESNSNSISNNKPQNVAPEIKIIPNENKTQIIETNGPVKSTHENGPTIKV